MRSLVRTKIEWQQWERSYRMPPEMTVKFLSHRMLEDGPLQSALTSTLNFIKEEQAREPSLGTQDYGRHLLDAVITHFSALPHLLKATYPAKEPSVTYTNRLRIDKASHNALVAVCSAGDIPFMRHLLNVYNYGPAACNTSPTLSSPFFGSPLHGAILGGHEEALTILRCYGADINTLYQRSLTDEGQNSQGFYRKSWSVLQDAANSGHASLVRLLLKSGVEPDLDDHAHRYRALLAAVRLGQSDVVDAFLEFGHHASEQIDADGMSSSLFSTNII
jgi:hypothetical protein